MAAVVGTWVQPHQALGKEVALRTVLCGFMGINEVKVTIAKPLCRADSNRINGVIVGSRQCISRRITFEKVIACRCPFVGFGKYFKQFIPLVELHRIGDNAILFAINIAA